MRLITRKITLMTAIVALLLGVTLQAEQANAFGKGSRGADVYVVQGMLKTLGYYPGAIDGAYGPLTEKAVRLFQQKYGLPVTGAVDAKTMEAIMWAYQQAVFPKAPPAKPPTPPKPPAPPPKPPTPTPPAKPPTPTPSIPKLSADEQQMLNLVNQERAKNGLKPLQANLELARVARIKSQEMITKNYFSHQSPTYGSPFEMMKKFGISFRAAGENIACNQSVAGAHSTLMNSAGHRANILSSNYTEIGIGIVNGGMCGKMFTQMFISR